MSPVSAPGRAAPAIGINDSMTIPIRSTAPWTPRPSTLAAPTHARILPPRRMRDGLARYRLYIDGAFVDPAGGEWIDTEDPVAGEVWARIPRGRAEDADRAVIAAHRAFTSGAWPAMSASRRGALLRKLGDLIARECRMAGAHRDEGQRQAVRRAPHADALHVELLLLLRRARRQDGGRGDSLRQARRLQLHEVRARRRRRLHHAVELAAAADEPEVGARAGGRQHRGVETVGIHVGVAARIRQAGRGRGIPARRRQRRDGLWRRGRRCAVSHPLRRPHRVHRRARSRPQRSTKRPRAT